MRMLPGSVLREVLHHDVSEHVGCWNECCLDGVLCPGIMDEVAADTDLLGVLMELRVLS